MSDYRAVLRGFASDAQLAEALAVPLETVGEWKIGRLPDEVTSGRLRDLAVVVSLLLEHYDPAAVPDWLFGNNPDLGGRQPVQVLRDGGLSEVLSAAEVQMSGSYI